MTLEEVLVQNLNIFLQNWNVHWQQTHTVLQAAFVQFTSIMLGALDAILPPY